MPTPRRHCFDYLGDSGELKRMKKLLVACQYDAFDEAFDQLLLWPQRYSIGVISSMPHDVLRAYYEGAPQSTIVPMIYVNHQINAAWEVRGAKRAHLTRQEDLEHFHRLMHELIPLGRESYERRVHPVSAQHMLTLSKTNTRGLDATLSIFEDAMRHSPGDYGLLDVMISYASNSKWFGLELGWSPQRAAPSRSWYRNIPLALAFPSQPPIVVSHVLYWV